MHTNPEVLALVALGERDAATADELDHIARCEVCGREVDELGHLSQVGRTISDHFTLETPSPEVWERIRAQLGFSADFSSDLLPPAPPPTHALEDAREQDVNGAEPATPIPPVVLPAPRTERLDSERRHPRRHRVLSIALAAVLALLAGVAGTLAWQQFKPLTDTVLATAPLQALPDWTGAHGEASLEQDPTGRQVLVVSMVTPGPVDGIQQVWLIARDQKTMVTLGNLTAPIERFTIPAALNVAEFPVVDVSAEPPDGDSQHSGNSIVRGTLDI
jgi:hypothetical protein